MEYRRPCIVSCQQGNSRAILVGPEQHTKFTTFDTGSLMKWMASRECRRAARCDCLLRRGDSGVEDWFDPLLTFSVIDNLISSGLKPGIPSSHILWAVG